MNSPTIIADESADATAATQPVAEHARRVPARISADALAFAVIACCHAPLLVAHFRRLWLYEQYHYVPFVLAAFVYFTWQRWGQARPVGVAVERRTSLILLVTSLVTLTFSLIVWSSWLAAVAAILTTGAALLHFGGRQVMSRFLAVWLLLWFLVPLPFRWDVQLIFELQTIASRAASRVLDFVHVDHLLAGHVLEIPRHKFLVEEACSGIHSLFALLAFAAILMIGSRRGWLHASLLLATAVFWATSINVVRVTSVVALFAWFDIDVATGWKHEMLGLLLFGIAMAMLLSTDRLLLFLFERPRETDNAYPDYYDDDLADAATESAPVAQGAVAQGAVGLSEVGSVSQGDSPRVTGAGMPAIDWQKRTRAVMVCAALFGVVGMAQVVGVAVRFDALRVVGEAHGKLNDAFGEDTLPEQIENWKRSRFVREERELTNNLGASFASWTYQSETAEATVTINYPFLGWHHLPACYEAQGWQIKSQEKMIANPGSSDAPREVWLLELVRPSGARMDVRFSQFDAAGQPVRPADWQLTSLRQAFRHSPFGRLDAVTSDTSTYQVVMQVVTRDQATTAAPAAPTDAQTSLPPVAESNAEADVLTETFLLARKRLAETITQRLRDDG